ncbi:MAG: type VI secretion system baseplate subunit TssE [Proteobacteria bacterium]|nr:MAG: type VI secretion system baseplate subunit TssE [Pseudomonadota bacterium]
MAELTHKERLQPSLLDRLTDDDPTAKQESRNQRVLSGEKLRQSVQRDLSWLLNTTNLAALQREVEAYPLVAESVLNYGLPDLAGHTTSGINISALERHLRDAIQSFEPRLLKSTIKVKLTIDGDAMNNNAMTFVIEAFLWAQPTPLRLFLQTAIDLETGQVEVNEMQG